MVEGVHAVFKAGPSEFFVATAKLLGNELSQISGHSEVNYGLAVNPEKEIKRHCDSVRVERDDLGARIQDDRHVERAFQVLCAALQICDVRLADPLRPLHLNSRVCRQWTSGNV